MAKMKAPEPTVFPTSIKHDESVILKGGDLRISDLKALIEKAHALHFPDDAEVSVYKYPSLNSYNSHLEPARHIITITPPARTPSNG